MTQTLHLRPLILNDQHTLLKWLSNPTLLEYYEGRDANYTLDKIKDDFFQADDTEFRFIVELNNRPIGYVQYYELCAEELELYGYKEENIYGMDLFIGETDLWNQGIGTQLVETVIQQLTKAGAKTIVLDPQVRNIRSIKCYEKCGFTVVKRLPNRELHEGKFEDCYLMEYRAHS